MFLRENKRSPPTARACNKTSVAQEQTELERGRDPARSWSKPASRGKRKDSI